MESTELGLLVSFQVLILLWAVILWCICHGRLSVRNQSCSGVWFLYLSLISNVGEYLRFGSRWYVLEGWWSFFFKILYALRLGFIKGERWEVILAFWGPHFCFLINLIAFCNGYVEWCPTTYQRMRNLRSLFSIFLFSKTATICWSDCAYLF